MPVILVQCLCPQRHCIMALADDETAGWALRELLKALVQNAIEAQTIQPHCGLCGATDVTWIYEVATTRYATMAEAQPALQQLQTENRRSADLMTRLGLAYDPPDPDPTRN